MGSLADDRARQLSQLSELARFASDGNDPLLIFADNVEDLTALGDFVREARSVPV